MTFLQLQTEVGELLNMTISASSTVTLTQVKKDLNTARDIVFNKLVSLGESYNERLAKADLVASQSLYGLPSDARKVSRLELDYNGTGDRYKADRINTNTENDPIDSVYTTSNPKWLLRGNNLEIKPTPDTNVTDGLWLYYVESLADMSGDTDTTELPIDYDYLLPLYAASKGSYTLGLREDGNNYLAQFKMGLADLAEEIIDRNTDEEYITIRDGYGGL